MWRGQSCLPRRDSSRRSCTWHRLWCVFCCSTSCTLFQAPPRKDQLIAMLLAIDAGNTNVTLGVFDGAALTHRWRLRTVREQTADEWGVLMRNLFSLDGVEPPAIHGIIVSSVVPSLDAS